MHVGQANPPRPARSPSSPLPDPSALSLTLTITRTGVGQDLDHQQAAHRPSLPPPHGSRDGGARARHAHRWGAAPQPRLLAFLYHEGAPTLLRSAPDMPAAALLLPPLPPPPGAPAAVESVDVAAHKKNPAVGTKRLLKLNKVCERGCVMMRQSVTACETGGARACLRHSTCLRAHSNVCPLAAAFPHSSHDQVWLDQADSQVVSEGEEVTLMDWGNAIIKV
jgi:hypothetical protein